MSVALKMGILFSASRFFYWLDVTAIILKAVIHFYIKGLWCENLTLAQETRSAR